jgi:hypothetical protein
VNHAAKPSTIPLHLMPSGTSQAKEEKQEQEHAPEQLRKRRQEREREQEQEQEASSLPLHCLLSGTWMLIEHDSEFGDDRTLRHLHDTSVTSLSHSNSTDNFCKFQNIPYFKRKIGLRCPIKKTSTLAHMHLRSHHTRKCLKCNSGLH